MQLAFFGLCPPHIALWEVSLMLAPTSPGYKVLLHACVTAVPEFGKTDVVKNAKPILVTSR